MDSLAADVLLFSLVLVVPLCLLPAERTSKELGHVFCVEAYLTRLSALTALLQGLDLAGYDFGLCFELFVVHESGMTLTLRVVSAVTAYSDFLHSSDLLVASSHRSLCLSSTFILGLLV